MIGTHHARRRHRRLTASLMADIRDAARQTPPGTHLASAAAAARTAGIPAVTIARTAMTSPAALAITELALFGQRSYPQEERP